METRDVEWNRSTFEPQRLLAARSASWAIVDEAFTLLRPGMTSVDAREHIDRLLVARTGQRPWHPTQVRIDAETQLPFGARAESPSTVRAESLAFIDMGPVVDGYEGDVAATRAVSGEAHSLALAAESLHSDLVTHWKLHRPTGRALYMHASERAHALGFDLATKGASGHRLADYPHDVRGQLRALDRCPRTCAWVLEIHLLDHARGLGAFYEDLLV